MTYKNKRKTVAKRSVTKKSATVKSKLDFEDDIAGETSSTTISTTNTPFSDMSTVNTTSLELSTINTNFSDISSNMADSEKPFTPNATYTKNKIDIILWSDIMI